MFMPHSGLWWPLHPMAVETKWLYGLTCNFSCRKFGQQKSKHGGNCVSDSNIFGFP